MLARIGVLVSGGGTNLQALIDAQGSVIKHGRIVAVVSSAEGAYALERAKNAGISAYTVPKRELTQSEFEARITSILREQRVDVVVLAGFMSILSAEFISNWPERIINVHPSLIPAYCGRGYYGLKVHEAVLAAGEKVTGATVHLVNEIPDGGRILLQKALAVEEGDTPETLQRRVMELAEWLLLPQALAQLCGEIEANGQ